MSITQQFCHRGRLTPATGDPQGPHGRRAWDTVREKIGQRRRQLIQSEGGQAVDAFTPESRNAIYGYLSAVYGLVGWWTAEGREIHRARRALRLGRLEVSEREDPFGAVIRCTADPAKADKRTRSKWSRVMRYAAAYKSDSEPLDQFIKRKGGINARGARFSRCLGRGGPVPRAVRQVMRRPVQRATDLHRLGTTGNVTLLESCHRDVPKVLDFSIAALAPSAGK
jgi:hypothetical protein